MCNCGTIKGKGQRHRQRCSNCTCPDRAPLGSLAACFVDDKVLVQANPDLKTIEMGLAPGALVKVLKNDFRESVMLVKVFEQRLAIFRETAENIMVK
jgi:Fe2+ transport system protein FeoA